MLIKENNEIIGTGGCVRIFQQDGLLKRFYIHKVYRGKGFAGKLLKKMLNTAKTLQISRIIIDVSKQNERAIHFYKKYGFKPYGPTPSALWPESSRPDLFNYYFLNIL